MTLTVPIKVTPPGSGRALRIDPQTAGGRPPRFGTDGIRGLVNHDLTPMVAYQLGRAAAVALGDQGGALALAQDTRRSGDMLAAAIVAGATSMGADVGRLGVAPTAALAFVTARAGYRGGIMVSASHNPADDNGLKVLGRDGLKLDERHERQLEGLMARADGFPSPSNGALGIELAVARELDAYRAHRLGIARRVDRGFRVVVDCANGAASGFASDILSATGAHVTVLSASPTGTNINQDCGAIAPGALAAVVREASADVGFAFDGDADRCVVVDEQGQVVDGDGLLGMLALDRLSRGRLDRCVLVATVLSNGGLEESVRRQGGLLVRTPVGDRFVWEGMAGAGAVLGGEKSGHVIIREHASTGDGIVTALEVLELIGRRQRPVSELAAAVTLWPQVSHAVPVVDRAGADADPVLQAAIADATSQLRGVGRLLVRPSGTEPLMRIMVEGRDGTQVTGIADSIADLVRRRHSSPAAT